MNATAAAARHLVSAHTLLHAYRHGAREAARAMVAGSHTCGWATAGSRGRLDGQTVVIDTTGETVRLAVAVAWALARLLDDEAAELARLNAERNEALNVIWPDTEAWHRQTYRPAELTDDERARIARGRAAQHAAEAAMHVIRCRVLARDEPPVDVTPGAQLDLFAEAS